MYTIKIENIKCGGCKNTITKALKESGATDIDIDILSGTVKLNSPQSKESIIQLLLNLGYPESGSKEAGSFLKKSQSYVSCALGKIS